MDNSNNTALNPALNSVSAIAVAGAFVRSIQHDEEWVNTIYGRLSADGKTGYVSF